MRTPRLQLIVGISPRSSTSSMSTAIYPKNRYYCGDRTACSGVLTPRRSTASPLRDKIKTGSTPSPETPAPVMGVKEIRSQAPYHWANRTVNLARDSSPESPDCYILQIGLEPTTICSKEAVHSLNNLCHGFYHHEARDLNNLHCCSQGHDDMRRGHDLWHGPHSHKAHGHYGLRRGLHHHEVQGG